MKKTRKYFSLFAILLMVIFALGCVFMAACGNKDDNKDEEPDHVHDYTVLNQGDDDGHYYTCSEGDGAKGEVIPHTWGTPTDVTAATCGKDGSQTVTCTVCEYTTTQVLKATGEHTYVVADDAVWTWADDYSDATVSATCSVCDDTTTVSAEEITSEVAKEATCSEEGEMTYTATYGTATDTKTAPIAKLPHTYGESEEVWSWSKDGENVMAKLTLTCDICGEEWESDPVAAAATETENEYTATITDPNGDEHTDVHELTGDEHEHNYTAGEWTWGTDDAGEMICTRTWTCDNADGECDAVTKTDKADVTHSTTKEATCSEEGEETYVATFGDEEEQVSTTTEKITKIPHTYGEPEWSWEEVEAEIPWTVTATFTCSECSDEQIATAEVTYDATTETYKATLIFEDKEYSDYRQEEAKPVNICVDFSDSNTYSWITGTTKEKTDESGAGTGEYYLAVDESDTHTTGVLSLYGTGMTIGKEADDSLNMGGRTSNAGDKMFTIDVSRYAGQYISIEVEFATNSNGTGRSMYLDTSYNFSNDDAMQASSTNLAKATSTSKNEKTTLSYVGLIETGETAIYLFCGASVNVYTITIKTGDESLLPEPEDTITLSADSLDLELDDGSTAEGTITVTITLADGTTYSETPTLSYNESANFTATVTAGDNDGEFVITVSATGVVEGETVTVTAGDLTASFTVTAISADDTIYLTVNKEAMSFYAANQTDTSLVSFTQYGVAYGGGETAAITFEYSVAGVATAEYSSDGIKVTAIGEGNTVITVRLTIEGQEDQTAEILVTVAINDIEDGYTATYVVDSTNKVFVTTNDAEDTNEEKGVTFSNTSTSSDDYKTSEKPSIYDSSVKYTDYTSVNASSKHVDIEVAEGVTAYITVYASHTTSTAIRTIYIKDEAGNILAGESIDGTSSAGNVTSGSERSYLWSVSAAVEEGKYTISANDTVHVYAVVVNYRYSEGSSEGATSTSYVYDFSDASAWADVYAQLGENGVDGAAIELDEDGVLLYYSRAKSYVGEVYVGDCEDEDEQIDDIENWVDIYSIFGYDVNGAFCTGGNSNYTLTGDQQDIDSYLNTFKFDLSSFVGKTVSIEITFSGWAEDSVTGAQYYTSYGILLGTYYERYADVLNYVPDSVLANYEGETDGVEHTLTWTGEIDAGNSELWIIYNGSVRISSITITVA